jgi:four helix bundle protein
MIYRVADALPRNEEYNLKNQSIRAATSVALNIAEGSTGQSDAEQNRFLGMALRSLIETVACLHLIKRRNYASAEMVQEIYIFSEKLSVKLQAFRNALK